MKKVVLISFLIATMSTTVAQSEPVMTSEDAERVVLDRYGGKILDTTVSELDYKKVYVVQVLIKGRKVRVFHVDANTGELMF